MAPNTVYSWRKQVTQLVLPERHRKAMQGSQSTLGDKNVPLTVPRAQVRNKAHLKL